MALTINLVQLKRKEKRDGTVPVYIRITEDRKSRYKATGYSIHPKHWNQKQGLVRKSLRGHDRLNNRLKKILREAQETEEKLRERGRLNMDTLRQQLAGDSDPRSILVKAAEWREQLTRQGQYWEARHFKVVIGNLETFIRTGKPDNLDRVDALWLEDFQSFLLSHTEIDKKTGEEKEVVNSPTTVRKKLQRLNAMFRWLVKSKTIKYDPFPGVDKVTPRRVAVKVKLSFDQIKAIQGVDLPERTELWHVRNYFLYSFYNAGIRFGDLCTLQWKNIIDGRLSYSMHKTNRQKSIKQLEPMLAILDLYRTGKDKPDAYIFPILDRQYDDPMELRKAIGSKNAQVNLKLKELAELAGIQASVSFHVSRHSFAHFALKKGMGLYEISKALGHSDLKVTQDYIKSFDEELLDKGMNKLFE